MPEGESYLIGEKFSGYNFTSESLLFIVCDAVTLIRIRSLES